MEPIYSQNFTLNDSHVDCFGRLKPSCLLQCIQEVASIHGSAMGADYDTQMAKNHFWAILRTRVQVTRLPRSGETITLKTWPMPTTRVAYPRSVIAFDENGGELFRAISLWVMMDRTTRAMVIPAKSGFLFEGRLEGTELAVPGSLAPRPMASESCRRVCFTDLDINGHMNNTRYFDWIYDLLSAAFHRENSLREFVICYLSEAREGEVLTMQYEAADGVLQVEGTRPDSADKSGHSRVFAAKLLFE